MKKVALAFAIVSAFSTMAMAYDIAFYVGAPNPGWYEVADQNADVATMIAKTGPLFKDVQRFDDAHLTQFGAWVDKNTNDGELDIIWLNGCTPSVLYQFPNVNADGSRAEKWLDGGNMIINVGDWFAYCSYEGGSRQADNGGTGAANILDLSSTIIAGEPHGEMTVTPTGQEYLPSLNSVTSERPVLLSAVVAPWEVAAIFASDSAGTYADPIVLHNTVTGGYIAFINQAVTWIDDRGLTCAEFIGNWVKNVVGLGPQPLARQPNPINGYMIDQTKVQASWQVGDFAKLHDVYFGESFEKVSAAAPNDADVYVGRQVIAQLPMGMAGGPVPGGLVPGKTYYWRVDEIDESNPASPWKGNVWSFWVRPQIAWGPTPADGAKYFLVDQKLTWNKGLNALFHYVSFGEDADAVKNAPAGAGMPAANEEYAPPEALKPGTIYYWRVDEFAPPATVQGEVWSFTTVPAVAVTDPHLVGYWAFDEETSDTAVDSSGYGHHGVLSGGIERTEGYFGGALAFGTGRVVNCGTGAAEQVTGDFTLAAWVRLNPGNAGIYGGIAGKLRYDGTNYYGFALVRHSGNRFRLWVGDGSADLAKSAVNSNGVYTDTEWHHVAGVHSGLVNSLYVDGVKQSASTSITLAPSTDWFHIGRQYSTQTDRTFSGLIDEVRVYDTAAADTDIAAMMRGNVNLAGNPEPANGAEVDIRDISEVAWSAGAAADSHDVYFGTDRKAVTEAGKSSSEFKGNQPGTSFSLSGLVAFGGGDYYWRIDEVAADGTTYAGYVWKFTVPAYLIVDDFDGYSDDTDAYDAVFQTWVDGYGYTQPVVVAGNGTTSTVGYGQSQYGTFGEALIVNPGGSEQSMPFDYNNINTPYYAEASRTWSTAQDWTKEGVTTLVLYVRGTKGNDVTQPLYVALENQGKAPVVVNLAAAALGSTSWTEQKIPLSQFTGVNLRAVKKMYLGVGDRASPKPGGHGILYIDDLRLVKP